MGIPCRWLGTRRLPPVRDGDVVSSYRRNEGVRSQRAPDQAEKWPQPVLADIRSHKARTRPSWRHDLDTVEPSTMCNLVDTGLRRYTFPVQCRGSLQLYVQGGGGVGRSHFIEASLERALAIASAIDPNCPPACAPLWGRAARPDVAVHFEATASQPTLGALLDLRRTSLLPMRSTTTPRTENVQSLPSFR